MPPESHFEPCNQRYCLFLVCGCRHLELLGAFLGRFLGHIIELEGRKELSHTGRSGRTWGVPTASLRSAVLNVFQGFLGRKMAVFGEAGLDHRGHLWVTWGVYLRAGKPPSADIILSHPPDLT